MREFVWPLRVYIEDTDAGGIVYYVNYLKYLERARTEFMRWHGFGKEFIFRADLMFVVSGVRLDYRKPARLDEELIATARVIASGAAHIRFEQRVLRGDDVLCSGDVQIVCVDRQSMKPRRIPVEVLAAITKGHL